MLVPRFFVIAWLMIGGTWIGVENNVTPRNLAGSAAISMAIACYINALETGEL